MARCKSPMPSLSFRHCAKEEPRSLGGGEGEATVTSASTGSSSPEYYYDVNNDNQLDVTDALGVIQSLRMGIAANERLQWRIVP